MGIKDKLLKKKDQGSQQHEQGGDRGSSQISTPEFTFMRTTTNTQEIITPPSYPGDKSAEASTSDPPPDGSSKRFSRFRRHTSAAQEKEQAKANRISLDADPSGAGKPSQKLAERLHLGRDRSATTSSVNIPQNLPEIEVSGPTQIEGGDKDEKEARWEQRATMLAKTNPNQRRGSNAAISEAGSEQSISTPRSDDDIQEAIRLHEADDLEKSTAMFGRLADPNGQNNALAQVLYGLALRHGWGCTPDPSLAIHYLSQAASNSAEVESLALAAGMKKGGSAKGELVLAIFELANCFRNGWGVKKDPLAAKQYYETAANLGDTDAMEQVAWCYTEGFGTKKDKVGTFPLTSLDLYVMLCASLALANASLRVRVTRRMYSAACHASCLAVRREFCST
jgi:TPR repeat protein